MPVEAIELESRISPVFGRDSQLDLSDVGAPLFIVSEDGAEFIVAEDGSTFIVAEQGGGAKAVELESRIF